MSTIETESYGSWTADEVERLVDAVVAIHGAVWPHGEVDGDGDPAGIVLEHAEATRVQVEQLRALAVELSTWPTTRHTQETYLIVDRLYDHSVLT